MPSLIRKASERVRAYLARPIMTRLDEALRSSDPSSQIQLKSWYAQRVRDGLSLPSVSEVGFKIYSQTDEDGILLYLMSVLGEGGKRAVEMCAGNGVECNTANLIINHGWDALLVDGDRGQVEQGIDFYRRCGQTYVYPPKMVHSWITRDNVNDLLAENGFTGEIDLLSLDMDGVDYWIWDAITVITPRVVVLEYQDILGPERSWTVPYSEDFSSAGYPMTDGMPNYSGASLAAFVKLGRSRNYRLVGVNRYGYNAFFVRNDVGSHLVPEIAISDCFSHPKVIQGMKERFPTISNHPWVEV